LKGKSKDNGERYRKASIDAGRKEIPGTHWVERSQEESEGEAQEAITASIDTQIQDVFESQAGQGSGE